MDYDALLSQVIDLLQREKRVPYRALKRRFDIDDDYIEDLKIDIIEAKQLAIDENDRILVWIGEPGTIPQPTAPSTQIEQQSVSQESQSISVEPPPTDHRSPEAERRQLTVMFCDLVDSTKLSSQIDPEDYREVVRDYQQVCSEVISRFDGYIAQYLGDGLLVYFGYPVAHEDDARRVIHTGLGILNAIETLNVDLEQNKGVELAVRLGIHTGLVVVGEIGGEGRQEQLALGETPNVASRIQGLAEPNTVVISDATYRLIQGFFDCEALGEHDLRGVSQPIAVYRVLGASEIQSRLDVASSRGLTPLVGRESESTLLFERWEQAKDSQGQVVLLSGEAGIGKSRLVQVLKDQIVDEPHTRLECRSSPYFTNSALYPITDMIQRTLRFQTDDTPEQKLEKLTHNLRQYRLPLEETVPLFGTLLSLSIPEDQYLPLTLSPQRQRQKTLEAIIAILLELAERQPVLFILEDLHWTDPTTLELLDLLIDQTPTASTCVLVTCRPEFQPSWSHHSYLTEMTINRLSQDQVEQIATQVAGGKTLPSEVIEQLVEKTDGVPLYVEEMTKAVLESGMLKDMDGQYELTGSVSPLSIPATIQDSLMARLDRLMTAKVVAQLGATIGRQFEYALLQAVAQLDESTLQRELSRMVESELLYQPGLPPQSTYIFKHALIQDTAYESLLRSTRQGYHRRIAEVLVERFPETVETQPELLAHHFTEGGLYEQAVGYWQRAAEQAIQRSAYAEGIAHLTAGLQLLHTLPGTPEHMQQEVALQTILGPAVIATKGLAASEVEHVYSRARELCQRLGDSPQLFWVLRGLWQFHRNRAAYPMAYELAQQLFRLADRLQDRSLLMVSHATLGMTMMFRGAFVDARRHVEQSLALYDAQHYHSNAFLAGMDSQVSCLVVASLVLWSLGYPAQALHRNHEALQLAQALLHLPTVSHALYVSSILQQHARAWQTTQELIKVGMALASEHGFVLSLARQMVLYGWTLVRQGHGEDGIMQIRQGLIGDAKIGAQQGRPWQLALLAEAYGTMGQVEQGLATLAEALTLVDKHGEHWYEAELHRLTGQLLLQQSPDNATDAESCFHQAISIAQNQSAKSWELRAATSLARLWQSQDKRDEARELLEPVYDWFTEGFDTADLIDAKALLDELALNGNEVSQYECDHP